MGLETDYRWIPAFSLGSSDRDVESQLSRLVGWCPKVITCSKDLPVQVLRDGLSLNHQRPVRLS
jgi:hypothetical protein